ncbi:membrane protein [Methyloradius palustris]|uniref:Membrane protein n=2 Tax=Methyloradius palustris TaxID=2778876 RepID=A0A8D5JQV0_9PROT|nr:membrane protein [Methyloradius palustris]
MSESGQKTPIFFTGNATEYFGIWIVNLLLSIVTLGIYSAWAKVRRKKYFYNNTLIDGVGFDYHANPVSILKGRAIAFVLFVIYSLSKNISPALSGALMLIFFLALPWIIVRGNIFNARNSSHRGLRFNFVGTVREAIRVVIGLPMLIPFTLGLIYPYVAHQHTKFIVAKHRFGTTDFDLDVKVGDFYKTYLKVLLFILLIAGALLALAAVSARLNGNHENLDGIRGLFMFGLFAGIFGILFFLSAYLHARLGNLIWNNASLDNLRFESNQRARDLFWIYTTNFILIIITFGLMTPWAQIRTQRYRVEHLAVVGEADFDKFVGDKKAEAKALGEEIADMFDVDLSFG